VSTAEPATDFDAWIAEELARKGAFTALAVLVEIGELTVTPLATTYFTVAGNETGWSKVTAMFAAASRRSRTGTSTSQRATPTTTARARALNRITFFGFMAESSLPSAPAWASRW